jgi:ribonuclease H / adenosylcobalamin/alpha-ribazole phosphatase
MIVTRLTLVRHGDCVQSATTPDPDLSELGRLQSMLLRDRLASSGEAGRASLLLSSPLARARETAEIVASAVGVPALGIIHDDGLREMSWGLAEGWRWDELARRYGEPAGPDDAFGPDGESWASFVKRGSAALSGIARAHAGADILAVAHTGIIEISFMLFGRLRRRVNRFEMKPFNTSLTTWISIRESDEMNWRLERYNDVAHLWRAGKILHRPDDYADLAPAGDPFWEAVGRESASSVAGIATD